MGSNKELERIPDYTDIRCSSWQNVENKFAQIASDKRFRFYGNVNIVGSQSLHESQQGASVSYTYPLATKLPFSSLLSHYTHVLLSYGSSLPRPLGISGSRPGELFNIHPALDFVNWYNGHPAAHDQEYIASQPWKQISLEGLRHATVVGAGNVALDVARILLRSTSTLDKLFQKDPQMKSRTALSETDIPEIVLDQLSKCRIDHVDIVARRGPAQVAFTNKELRELMDLQNVHYQGIEIGDMNLAKGQITALEIAAESQNLGEIRVRKRLLGILEKGSKAQKEESVATWSTSFFQSPRQFLGEAKVVKQIEWDEMKFQGLPTSDEESQPWSASMQASNNGHQLVKTGQTKKTSTDLVITSVGYQGAPLDGLDPIQTATGIIPWNAKKGIIPNRGGKVMSDQGKPVSAILSLLLQSHYQVKLTLYDLPFHRFQVFTYLDGWQVDQSASLLLLESMQIVSWIKCCKIGINHQNQIV